MVIKWTNFAKKNLYNFKSYSKSNNAKDYIKSLVTYIQTLKEFQNLGKSITKFNSIEIRQLIYEKHRILYYVSNQTIYIIAIIHMYQNLAETMKEIKNILNENN